MQFSAPAQPIFYTRLVQSYSSATEPNVPSGCGAVLTIVDDAYEPGMLRNAPAGQLPLLAHFRIGIIFSF
jgi:hypothetical protein